MYSLIQKVFQGVPNRDFFAFLQTNAEKLKSYPLIEVPCVGTFSIPLFLIRNLGYPPEQILASDISDYCGMIYHVIENGAGDGQMANYLMAQMTAKYGAANVYGYEKIAQQTAEKWHSVWKVMKGLRYVRKDVLKCVSDPVDGRFLICEPPNVKDGYKKMFPKDTFGGEQHFQPSFVDQLFHIPNQGIIHTSMLPSDPLNFTIQGYIVRNRFLTTKVYSNAPLTSAVFYERKSNKLNYALATRQDLYDPSKIGVVPLKVDDALSLRDLFVHRLGQTKAENYLAITLNDKVFAIVGMMITDFNRGKTEYISEHFGMTVPLPGEKTRKLQLMLMLSREWLKYIPNKVFLYRRPAGIKTTCLSPHPSVMADRGVLDLKLRERQKNGSYKLSYSKDFQYDTFAEAYAVWKRKYGHTVQPVGEAGDLQSAAVGA